MADFKNDDVIWRAERTWENKTDVVQLERGEYQGKSTYTLREMWVTPEGELRWSKSRPTQKGDCWAAFRLRSTELEGLARALIAESRSPQPALPAWTHPIVAGGPSSGPPQASRAPARTPPPREQKQMNAFDDQTRSRGRLPPAPEDESDLPF